MKRKQQEPKKSPLLRTAFLQIVASQLHDNDPPETRLTFERLINQGINESEARMSIAGVIALETFQVTKDKESFNKERFIRNLKALPREPRV